MKDFTIKELTYNLKNSVYSFISPTLFTLYAIDVKINTEHYRYNVNILCQNML